MLSSEDLERLITAKRHEIDKEKIVLGLSPANNKIEDKENIETADRRVRVSRPRALSENNVAAQNGISHTDRPTYEDEISPGLDRYIRRQVGLPAMLKAGEYSPNNPLVRAERSSGDALLGLGEYERRRNTLRKIRQRQYKEYLDQQAKKKQEAKEQAELERKEREEKERLREERERERLELERINSPERRRASVSHSYVSGANNTYITKVDTGVQVDHRSTPLSVAVQTDDDTLFRISTPSHNLLTQAERELSPHTVGDAKELQCASHAWDWKPWDRNQERRRSYGDYDERSMSMSRKPRERLASELRHTYMPSIFDAEAIKMRNEQAEKEALERRQFYQQELKNQILEQQRIKEERKTREKMLEQAEMRRLEEQLRSLKMAQEREIGRHHDIQHAMKDNASEYERKRTTLQKEIDLEHQALLKAAIHPKRNTNTSKSESPKHSKLPFFYNFNDRPPYTANIPENSIFSQNYDVDSYLRRNLNPAKESLCSNRIDNKETENKNIVIEKALVHETPKELRNLSRNSEKMYAKDTRKHPENPNVLQDFRKLPQNLEINKEMGNLNDTISDETLPIPVLRHSPKQRISFEEKTSDLSEKMQIVEDKWKVPVVQKNILKSLPNEKGKNVSILTQLGSIRRQLQLEQLKLDKMLSKNHS